MEVHWTSLDSSVYRAEAVPGLQSVGRFWGVPLLGELASPTCQQHQGPVVRDWTLRTR